MNTPRLSRLLLVVEKNEKASENSSEMITKLFQSFFANYKFVVPMAKNGQIFEFFSRLSNIVSENLHYLGNNYS